MNHFSVFKKGVGVYWHAKRGKLVLFSGKSVTRLWSWLNYKANTIWHLHEEVTSYPYQQINLAWGEFVTPKNLFVFCLRGNLSPVMDHNYSCIIYLYIYCTGFHDVPIPSQHPSPPPSPTGLCRLFRRICILTCGIGWELLFWPL